MRRSVLKRTNWSSFLAVLGLLSLYGLVALPGHAAEAWENRLSAETYFYDLAMISGATRLPAELGGYQIKDRFSPRSLQEARRYLARRLHESGFDELQTEAFNPRFQSRSAKAVNLYVDIRGTKKPNEVVIVSAHYDTYGRSIPGANDNGSGTIAVLSLARAMKLGGFRPLRTLRFALFDVEEAVDRSGVYEGSELHLEKALLRGEKIKLMVNMDMIGHSPSGLRSVCFDPVSFSKVEGFVRKVNELADMPFDLELWPGYYSDHESAIVRGIPALSVFEKPLDRMGRDQPYYPYYHTEEDRIDKVNIQYALQVSGFVGMLSAAAAQMPSLQLENNNSSELQIRALARAKNRRQVVKEKSLKASCGETFSL